MPRSATNRLQHKSPDLDKRIQAHWQQMPSSEQRVAEFLLHSPGALVSHTATELASMTKTSKAAVSRLIQRLGYGSFSEARQLVRAAQDWGSPIYMGIDSAPAEQSIKRRLAKQFAMDQANLDKTWRAQDEKALQQSVELLSNARQVVLLGYRNSADLAHYLSTQLSLLRDGVVLAAPSNETLATLLHELEPTDLVVAVSLRRRVPVLLKTLDLVRKQSTPLLLITDPSGLSIRSGTDILLQCHCQSMGMFDNYAAAMSLLNFLLGQTAAALGEKGRARLRRIERLHVELNDLI